MQGPFTSAWGGSFSHLLILLSTFSQKGQAFLKKVLRGGLQSRNLRLSVTDYCNGLQPDSDRQGDIWVFGGRSKDYDNYLS